MNIPKLRFPEFKDTYVKDNLKNRVELFNGYAFKSKDSCNIGIRWIKIADVGIGRMIDDNPAYLPKSYLQAYSNYILNQNDYVIALTRPVLNGKLKIAKITDKQNKSLLNQRVAKLIAKNSCADFIYYLLQTNFIIKSIENNIAGTDPPNLSYSDIKNIKTYFPALTEQTKIANFLSEIDKRIKLLTDKVSKLEEYKKGAMQKLFSQEVRFKDENGEEFPEWENKSFLKCIKSISIRPYQIKSSEILNKGKFKVIDQGYNPIAGFSNKEDKLFTNTPVIIFGDHTTILKFSICPFIVGADGVKLLTTKDKSHDIKYLFYWLNYSNVEQQGYRRHYSLLAKNKIRLPSLPEQTKIANFLSSIDSKIELATKELHKTEEYKKGLLQQMFI